MGIADQYGTLEQGKFADFLVLEKDPMADVKAFQQKDKQVYQGGKRQYWYTATKLLVKNQVVKQALIFNYSYKKWPRVNTATRPLFIFMG